MRSVPIPFRALHIMVLAILPKQMLLASFKTQGMEPEEWLETLQVIAGSCACHSVCQQHHHRYEQHHHHHHHRRTATDRAPARHM